MMHFGFTQAACEILPLFKPKEFFRPAQVDVHGNFNNIVIGEDYDRPNFRLPGCGGIGDVTTFSDKVYLYVPRHSRAIFVERVDFVSGLGHSQARRDGAGPQYLVSNLGQFDFLEGRMRVVTLHPGVSLEKVRGRTGFRFETATDLRETELPTNEELALLREAIDPLGVRRLETGSGSERKRFLREILSAEGILTDRERSIGALAPDP
jgi:glutaconate CoA-transferase subunit B